MKRVITQSQNDLLRKFNKEDEHSIKFKISPEKKAHLEDIVSEKRVKVANVLKEWIRKDRSFLSKKEKK